VIHWPILLIVRVKTRLNWWVGGWLVIGESAECALHVVASLCAVLAAEKGVRVDAIQVSTIDPSKLDVSKT